MKKYFAIAAALATVALNLNFAEPAEAKHRHGCGGGRNNNWNNGWGNGGFRRNKHWGHRNRGWGNNWNRGCGGYRTSGLRNMFRFY